MKKELKAIHEFLADQFAVSENTRWQYAELLLMQALNTNQHLVNPFFHNQIKRRIAMITTSKKPSHQYLRKMMVLPVAATVIGLFAFSYKEKQADKNNQPSEMLQVFSDTIKPIVTDNKTFDRVEIEPSFPGGAPLWRKYLERNLDASVPVKKKAPDGAYTVVVQFIVDKEGKISDAKPMTKHGYGMEEEGVRIIKAGPNWTPAVQNGRIVKAYRKQPITFVVGKGDKNFPSNVSTTGNELNEVVVTGFSSTAKTDNIIFDMVETPPQFPGGALKWRQYLERNLDATAPIKKKAQDGTYTVVVQFIVDKEGNISDVKGLTNHEYGMEEEAIRVIKKGPQWLPAIQNGQPVRAYKRQAITFILRNGGKNFPSNVASPDNEYNEVVVTGFSSTAKTDNIIFDKVETSPHFPGGDTAWRRYLQRNINALVPVDSGAPAGTYKVIVQFIVHENGQISDIKSTTKHGFGMEKEAIRIIEDGPGWIPAMQNGHVVRAYVQQPITFQVEEEQDPVTISNPVTKTSLNTFYIGVPNRLTIKVSNVKPENLFVKISTGSIKGDNGNYIAIVNSVGETSLEIYSNENGIKKKISQKTFKTHFIPDPRSENFKEVASSLGLKVNIINK